MESFSRYIINFDTTRSQGKFCDTARVYGEAFPKELLLPGGRHEGRIWQPFLLPLELKKQRNIRNDRLSCTEDVHKIIRARIPFHPEKRTGCCHYELLANSWGFLPALTCKRRGFKVNVTCLCKRRHEIT